MSASYCFVLHGRCIAPRVRDSMFAEHQRPQVAAFMECVDFMQPRWPSRISTFNLIFCRSSRFGTRESVGDRTRLWYPHSHGEISPVKPACRKRSILSHSALRRDRESFVRADCQIGWLQRGRNLLGRITSGCSGPIRTEFTIPMHSFPQRIAPLRRASVTNDSDS